MKLSRLPYNRSRFKEADLGLWLREGSTPSIAGELDPVWTRIQTIPLAGATIQRRVRSSIGFESGSRVRSIAGRPNAMLRLT
jgi:hypothetical protein